jgi:hypothetical protein
MGRKSLKSFWLPNRRFRGIVCFQWLNPIFVSPYFVHARTDQKPPHLRASPSTNSTLGALQDELPNILQTVIPRTAA